MTARPNSEASEPNEASEPSEASSTALAMVGASDGVLAAVELCCLSDVGLVRERNEDAFLMLPLATHQRLGDGRLQRADVGESGLLLAVFDGMGGAASGDLASFTAAESVARFLTKRARSRDEQPSIGDETMAAADLIYRALRVANAQIRRVARKDERRAGMGTTVTAALLRGDGQLALLNVGDSRAYVLREGTLTQVTEDQSLANELISQGDLEQDDDAALECSNVILQALGVSDEVEPVVSVTELRRGDRLLLCSDGLTDMASDAELREALAAAESPAAAAEALVELAKAKGGLDNVTVLVARVEAEGLREAGGSAVEVRPLCVPSHAATLRRRALVRYVSCATGALALILVIAALIVLWGTAS